MPDGLFRREGQPLRQSRKKIDTIVAAAATSSTSLWKRPCEHPGIFQAWATGATGLPLIDAGSRELMTTGYISNRIRQNMVSVLAKDLHLDWRMGAEWFQFCLEDHCVAANWGNWRYFSGVGSDPKQRHFRTISQALRYDRKGQYVRKWLPVLANVKPNEACFRPWDYLPRNVWKYPIVDPATQYTWKDQQILNEKGRLLLEDS